MQKTNISYSFDEFRQLPLEQFSNELKERHLRNHNDLAAHQNKTWNTEFRDMQDLIQGRKGRILFEYGLLSLQKYLDVVLLIEGHIIVLEYKDNSLDNSHYNDADKKQARGYALRLKYFHSTSNTHPIVPILVVPLANAVENVIEYDEDGVSNCLCCNRETLAMTIDEVLQNKVHNVSQEWEDTWEHGIYKSSPTIIEAARNVWRQNNVQGFKMGEADSDTRLAAERYITDIVVPQTRSRQDGQRKSICFVTGVPGAGKTLVGLDVSVALQQEGASMLSGNGPLVEVLTTALKRDLTANKKNLNKPKDEVSVESIIRDAYGYKKEIFEKRLDYHVGQGLVTLKPNADRGSQHVIIFDEAQRAWNKEKMIRPGQTGRKEWQEPEFPFSEAGLLLWDMNQRDWGVFVCLVGGGQEINTGEAGIAEWLKALDSEEFKHWHVYMADELKGEEYNREVDGAHSIEYYRNKFANEGRLCVDESLHLTACQRSSRSDKVASFIQCVLSCDSDEAKKLYSEFKEKFHIYLTRDVEVAKDYLRERVRELDPMGNENRVGILMSSKAARIRPLGYEIKKVGEYLNKVANWFLDDSDNINSSNFMEVALNEFFVQGLELDLDALIWDADFRYDSNENVWKYYDFNGRYWSAVDKNEPAQDIKRFYMKNAYRVLLTRARKGMVIVVPEGSPIDPDGVYIDKTRKPEFYDCTFNYLKEILGEDSII